jgi:hypothetical protein
MMRRIAAGAQGRMPDRGFGIRMTLMGIQENGAVFLQTRQAAGKKSGEALKIIGTHLIDDNDDDEFRSGWRLPAAGAKSKKSDDQQQQRWNDN